MTSSNGSARHGIVLVGALVLAALLYPPLYAYASRGVETIFGYFAADSFYFLTIAANSQSPLDTTFNQEDVTNGYHPLWQYLLIVSSRSFDLGRAALLRHAFFLSVTLTAAGYALAACGIYRATRSVVCGLWLVPGLFHLFFMVAKNTTVDLGVTYMYLPWSFMNGLETPLTCLLGGSLVYFSLAWHAHTGRPGSEAGGSGSAGRYLTGPRCALVGMLMAIAILSRLDDVFLVTGFVAFILVAGDVSRKLQKCLIVAAPSVLCVVGYMVFSHYAYGRALPVSGAMKMSGTAVLSNALDLVGTLSPLVLRGLAENADITLWQYRAIRVIPLVVPMILGGLAVGSYAALRRNGSPACQGIAPFVPLWLYVLQKGLYNFLFVKTWDQGYWYFALTIMIVNAFVVVTLFEKTRLFQQHRRIMAALWVCVYLLTSANVIHLVGQPNYWFDLWDRRQELATRLERSVPGAKIIDTGDGLMAYALGAPAASITGLVASADEAEAAQEGRTAYVRHLVDKGYDVVICGPHFYVNSCDELAARAGMRGERLFSDKRTQTGFMRLQFR